MLEVCGGAINTNAYPLQLVFVLGMCFLLYNSGLVPIFKATKRKHAFPHLTWVLKACGGAMNMKGYPTCTFSNTLTYRIQSGFDRSTGSNEVRLIPTQMAPIDKNP